MKLSALIELLQSLPEIRAMMRCAYRFKLATGLSGGVLRNIVIADPNAISEEQSLFDFVDPFGDIDIVCQSEIEDGAVLQALISEIGDADSHIWDPQTIDARKRESMRPGAVAADRLIAWFKGLPGQKRAIEIEAVAGDVERILDGPLAVEVGPVTHGNTPSQISRLIKFARIQLNLVGGQRRLIEPFAALSAQIRATDATTQAVLIPRRSFPIALELAQLFMTMPNWSDAKLVQNQLRELIPKAWVPETSVLGTLLAFESREDVRLGAALYRPSARKSLRLDFFTSDPSDEASSGTGQNRVPFAKVRFDNREERGCCSYVDFEEGIASIAWRHTNPEVTRGDERLEPSEYGLVSFPVLPRQTTDEARAKNRRIPMLGYLRRGRSVVVRFDPAYLKLATGRKFSTFVIGLVSIAVADGETLPPVIPQSAEPQGQGHDEKPKARPKPGLRKRRKNYGEKRAPVLA